MGKVKSYLSLIKFSHTIFAMPFALIGFFTGLTKTAYDPFSDAWRNRNAVYQQNLNMTVGWEGDSHISNDSLLGKIILGDTSPLWLSIQYFLLVVLLFIHSHMQNNYHIKELF